jgi:type IV secretory pathway VirB2 component (pilin)
MLNSSMIEQLKQFVDRQTPVSLLLAVVGVIFTVMTCIEALQLGVLILIGVLRPVLTVFGGSFLTEGFTNSGILSFQFIKILMQALLLVLLRHFLW